MAAFATGAELKMLRPETGDDLAGLVVELVSDGIRAGVRWQVDQVEDAELVEHVHDGPRRTVVLPAFNITQVEVVADGRTLDPASDFTLDGRIITLARPAWSRIAVTYTAGFESGKIPGVFRTVALEHAVEFANDPTGRLQRWQVGEESEAFFQGSGRPATITDDRLAEYTVGVTFS